MSEPVPLSKQIAEIELIGQERAHQARQKRKAGQTIEADNIELRLHTLRAVVRTIRSISKGE